MTTNSGGLLKRGMEASPSPRLEIRGGITDGIFASGIFREECTVISKNSAPDWESDNAAMCVAGEDQIIVIWCNLFKVITSMIKKNVKIFVRSDRKGSRSSTVKSIVCHTE